MKKIFFAFLLVLFCLTNHSYAQVEWKERAEFYNVFNEIFLSAQVGNITPAIERKQELQEKLSPFYKSAMAKFTDPKDKRRRHLVVLGERITYFNFLNANVNKIVEVWYGRLVLIHNKYHKILLDNEEPHISKSLLKHYEKEEDDFTKKEKKGLFNQNSGTTKQTTSTLSTVVQSFSQTCNVYRTFKAGEMRGDFKELKWQVKFISGRNTIDQYWEKDGFPATSFKLYETFNVIESKKTEDYKYVYLINKTTAIFFNSKAPTTVTITTDGGNTFTEYATYDSYNKQFK
jgi:hypothetical protein